MSDYDLSSLRIMIADDHQPMRHILRGILREWGISQVSDVASGREALEALRDFPADILIVDYAMSPIDGIQLTKMIRAGEEGVEPFVPVILVTAYTEMKTILEARDAGVNEFLAKPISAKLVYYRIRSIIERPRPFVRAEEYFGPDRRRRDVPVEGQDRRETAHEGDGSQRRAGRE